MSEDRDQYWSIIGTIILFGILGGFGAWFLSLIFHEQGLAIMGGYVLLAIAVWLTSARWYVKRTIFTCPKCNHRFKLSAGKFILSYGHPLARHVRCPECRKRSWCDAEPSAGRQ
jgi:hypothetical protein